MATITFDDLEKNKSVVDINSADTDGKHYDVDFGNRIALYMARDSVNKIDAQVFNNIDNTKSPVLRDVLLASDFVSERQRAGEFLSLHGEVFVVWIYYQNKWYIQFMQVVNYNSFKKTITHIVAHTFDNYVAGKKYESFYYQFSLPKNKGEQIVGRCFRYDDEQNQVFEPDKDIIYPRKIQFIPGAIIQNNYSSEPDFFPIVAILKELNVLTNDLGIEWENIASKFNNFSSLTNKGATSKTIEAEVKAGKRFFDAGSYNARGGTLPISPFISGSTSLDSLLRAIIFLEDRAMKYSFYSRDFDGAATNKHNLQISLFAQASGEYIQTKKEQRQRDYLYFFNMAARPEIGIIDEPIKSITIYKSAFEQGKIEGLKISKAQKELYKAQAQNQKSQAEKNRAFINNPISTNGLVKERTPVNGGSANQNQNDIGQKTNLNGGQLN